MRQRQEHRDGGRTTTQVFERIRESFSGLRRLVVKPARGYIPYDYVVPGGFYEQLWDWDGFFIALHFAGRTPPQPVHMANWARTYIDIADEDGWTPGCVTTEGRRSGIVGFQMKPFLAQGVELAWRLDAGGRDWVAASFDRLVKIVTLRERTHRDDATGLFFWDDAMQSGADNNPAIGNDPSQKGLILSCDINACMWREYLALARVAGRLGRGCEADGFRARAHTLQSAFLQHLWEEKTRSCWNRHRLTHEWIRRVSFSNFVPLWAGMLPRPGAQAMIREYLWNEAHMLGPHGLRTLSRQDPEYNNVNMIVPYSNWQGPIWPIACYFYAVGLLRYGFHAEAAQLAERLARLCLDDIEAIGSMHENYDAETGVPLAPSAGQSRSGIEGGFIGWNLLVQDMLEMSGGKPDLLSMWKKGCAQDEERRPAR